MRLIPMECDYCQAQAMGAGALLGQTCEICKKGVMEEADTELDEPMAFYAASARRTEYIQIRLSPREKKSVQAEAKNEEKTMSDYLVDLHRDHMRRRAQNEGRVIKNRRRA